MATRTTDLPVAFRGTPQPFVAKVTSAEKWYAGSLIYTLAAGGTTKTWSASLSFLGICPYYQDIAAGGTGLVYMGPFVAVLPDTTAGLAAGDEGDSMQAIAAGDNWLDCTKANNGVGTDTASLVGRLLRFVSTTEVYVAIKDPCIWGVSKTAATATGFVV